MDVQIIEKIVHEVKSQGVFDEFRKHSMADVDTKPAYQNLRQRVENSVKTFLDEQKWSAETNKNQLREKLRRHLTDSGFLDVGVERIVDQVVNPKIGSVFRPRIEEIVYKYLGVAPPPKTQPPPPPIIHPLPPLPLSSGQLSIDTANLLPHDLEQISPDSDKITVQSEDKNSVCNMEIDDDDQLEDDESPPYEPLIKASKDHESKQENHIKTDIDEEPIKTAENDVLSEPRSYACDNQDSLSFVPVAKLMDDDKDASRSLDKKLIPQESQLSIVSSDSITETEKLCPLTHHIQEEVRTANISEEAQMPKFNENSNEINVSTRNAVKQTQLHFDINKDEIKFIGTERKLSLAEEKSPAEDRKDLKDATSTSGQYIDEDSTAFKFGMSANARSDQDVFPCASNTQKSFSSLSEDTASLATKGKETSEVECISSPRSIKDNSLITPSSTSITTPTSISVSPTIAPAVTHQQQKEKEGAKYPHKHKHHTKERRHSKSASREHRHRSKHSKDGHRVRDSQRHRHSSSSSRSKHSSTSTSKHHKSASKKVYEKTMTTSKKHSRSDDKRRHHRHHSSSHNSRNSQKEYSSSSSTPNTSAKNNERKDDHNEAKDSFRRRKSNDSNDENDNYMNPTNVTGPCATSTILTTTSTSNSKSINEHKSPNSSTSAKKDEARLLHNNNNNNITVENPMKTEHIKNNNVVILNDILENPHTNFIKFHHSEQQASVQIIVSSKAGKEADITNADAVRPFKENMPESIMERQEIKNDLLYFDETRRQDYEHFLKILDDLIEMYRCIKQTLQINTNLSSSSSSDSKAANFKHKDNRTVEDRDKKRDKYDELDHKRLKLHNDNSMSQDTVAHANITIDSNENNLVQKPAIENEKIKKPTLHTRLKDKLAQQQRYNSEDLYKPRPIFGQRSRRRCLNTLL